MKGLVIIFLFFSSAFSVARNYNVDMYLFNGDQVYGEYHSHDEEEIRFRGSKKIEKIKYSQVKTLFIFDRRKQYLQSQWFDRDDNPPGEFLLDWVVIKAGFNGSIDNDSFDAAMKGLRPFILSEEEKETLARAEEEKKRTEEARKFLKTPKTDLIQTMYGELDPKYLDETKKQLESIRLGELAPLAVWLAKSKEEYSLSAKVPIYSAETNAFLGVIVFSLREKGWIMFVV